jgi:hypothetical protein
MPYFNFKFKQTVTSNTERVHEDVSPLYDNESLTYYPDLVAIKKLSKPRTAPYHSTHRSGKPMLGQRC